METCALNRLCRLVGYRFVVFRCVSLHSRSKHSNLDSELLHMVGCKNSQCIPLRHVFGELGPKLQNVLHFLGWRSLHLSLLISFLPDIPCGQVPSFSFSHICNG